MADLERQEDKALDRALDFVIRDLLPCEPGVRDCKHQRVLDAVLPVVQAHERDLIEEIEEFAVELAYERAALSSLRSRVAQLADELDKEATLTIHPETARSFPTSYVAHLGRRGALGDAARRLRSLLPQERQPEKGAD